jgi:hypothetical protein
MWERHVSEIQQDITGKQKKAYKIMGKLNKKG